MAVTASTIFSSALLLFLIQPLIGRYLLPWFGGSPGVWTACMLFFQLLLLAGYAYAHGTTRLLSLRAQAGLHLVLLGLALLSLPIEPAEAWKPAPGDAPVPRILALLAVSIGPSYFVLASTGPLLQRWFSVRHGNAPPYRLYALSNVGSLAALLAYPFAIEPLLSRHAQALAWSAGMAGFAVLCGACALGVLRATACESPAGPAGEGEQETVARPSLANYVLWLAFPTVASAMLLAVTNKVSEELAVVPFLWVLPLAIYLLSFVLCFDSPRWYVRPLFGAALLLWMGGYDTLASETVPIALSIVGYAFLLFVVCMLCHGELYRMRPHPRHLTAFYLVIAVGGALGGILVTLVAPSVFVYYEELPLGILAAGVLVLVALYLDKESPLHRGRPRIAWLCLLVSFIGLGRATVEAAAWHPAFSYASRDFHGGLYVRDLDGAPPARVLWSGNTQHGLQLAGRQRTLATGYYAKETGVGRALQAMRKLRAGGAIHVGVVGLGVGTLAAYGEEGDRFRFYEIDPRVLHVAQDRFTYLTDSAAQVDIVLGDARLALETEEDRAYDLLVLDAFTSDAIPVHLLTHEAFDTHLRHLRPDGLLAVHISNRHLDLRPVMRAMADEHGLAARVLVNGGHPERPWIFDSVWVLLSREARTLAAPEIARAATLDGIAPRLWTDERASLFAVLGSAAVADAEP